MPRLRHPTLTCTAGDTNGRTGRSCRVGVRACAAPTCRSASVDRHEAVRVALLHQLPSAATRHAPMLHLSSAPHFAPHTLRGQYAGTHTHTHTHPHTHTHQEKYEESTSKFRALMESSESLVMKCFSSLTLQTRAPGALVEP